MMHLEQNKPEKILIVDDNPRNVEVVASLLSDNNYDIEFAASGEEGLQWVDKKIFDLIMMDVMMPGINGYETCRQIKEKESCRDIPVIFLTAKTDMESLSKAFEAGGVDYVSKPFRPRELLARVTTHLELKRSREKLKHLNAYLEEKVVERTKELEEANRQLEIAVEELELLDSAKTDFLHMVSHEIRTPLNGILGGVELLKMGEIGGEFKQYLDILDHSTQRLEHFSFLTLNISELQIQGEALFHLEKLSLPSILKVFVREYVQSMDLSEGRLKLAPFNGDITLITDRVFFNKVLRIVVENAVAFSPDDKPVQIQAGVEDGHPVCTIRDKGPGFPAAMLKETITGYTPGFEHHDQHTGLNLHFASTIMKYFKGKLQLANNSEGGAKVRLVFPKYG